MEGTRRLAAIMFTDIVGYTAIMERDETEAVRIRERHRQTFRKYHEQFKGEIIQYYGDGTLSIFNSSVQAVKCAIEIQQDLNQPPVIPLRIGIHMGDIVQTSDDIIGDGVNIASRIQSLSSAGAILISSQVQYQLRNHGFQSQSLGLFRLKNVSSPLELFTIIADGITVSNRIQPNPAGIAVTPKKEPGSIVILPFVNMSNDPDQEYFCDGITEEIINTLTQLSNLKVIARTSAFTFKNKNEDIRSIAKKLAVQTLLEGSVRKSGNRIRITAQLINADDGTHIWSEKYDRELQDIFEIQDELAMAITDVLKVKLNGEARKQMIDSNPSNLDAYNYFLKGQFEWYKRTREGMTNSIAYFNQALQLDPDYGPAKAGIANAYIAMTDWGEITSQEGLPKARAILEEAIERNIDSAEVYASFTYLNIGEWNFKEYDSSSQRALELNPNQPIIYHLIALTKAIQGKFEEAISYNGKARFFDPLSLIFNFAYGLILYLSNNPKKAIKQFEYTITLNHNFLPAYLFLLYCYLHLDQTDDASAVIYRMLYANPDSAKYVEKVKQIHLDSGFEGLLNWYTEEGIKFYNRHYNHPYHKALLYTKLNNIEKAFEQLDIAYRLKSFRLIFILVDPGFDKLRNDSRLINLISKFELN